MKLFLVNFISIMSLILCTSGTSLTQGTENGPTAVSAAQEESTAAVQRPPSTITTNPGYYTRPNGLVVDPEGYMYVVDTDNHRIQKFKPTGDYVDSWGKVENGNPVPGTGDKEFSSPSTAAIDNMGNIYVADTGNARIQKFSPDGTPLIKPYQNRGRGKCQLLNPTGITVDLLTNSVYVTDTVNYYAIKKFDENLTCLDSSPGDIPRQSKKTDFKPELHGFKFANIFGLSGGMCFTALDYFSANTHIPKIRTASVRKKLQAAQTASLPDSIKDKFNKMTALADKNREDLRALTLGEFQAVKESIDAGMPAVIVLTKGSKLINWMPHHQVIAEGYDIYQIADKKTAVIYTYDPDCRNEEQFMTLTFSDPAESYLQYRGAPVWGFFINSAYKIKTAPSAPPSPTAVQTQQSLNKKRVRNPDCFWHPYRIAADFESNIYVADRDNHRIQKFSPRGKLLDTWGRRGSNGNPEPGSGEKEFFSPSSVAIDIAGNVYVADTDNARIQKFSPDGTLIKTYQKHRGRGECMLLRPTGITADLSRDLIYVTDTENCSVQIFDENLNCSGWVPGDVPAKQGKTNFDPSSHGFPFLNKRQWGVCGGMCFSALDYFYDNRHAPRFSDRALSRLNERQLDSLKKDTLPELKKWTNFLKNNNNQGNGEALKEHTRKEFEELKDRIDAGVPTVIVLIRSMSYDIWTNHQIVAVGYVENQNNKVATLYIYDPNDPGKTNCMTLNFNASPQNYFKYNQRCIYGFFINTAYTPAIIADDQAR